MNADRKLPKRRRIVRSVGTMPAAVHESAIGNRPNSDRKLRTACRATASRFFRRLGEFVRVAVEYVRWVRIVGTYVHPRGFGAVTTLRSIAVSPELCVAAAEFKLTARHSKVRRDGYSRS